MDLSRGMHQQLINSLFGLVNAQVDSIPAEADQNWDQQEHLLPPQKRQHLASLTAKGLPFWLLHLGAVLANDFLRRRHK